MSDTFTYEMLEGMGNAVSTGDMIYNVVTIILGIVGYFLRSIALYTMAKRRGIANPWLAWIPMAWVWVLGSISDQFRYVTKAQVKNKRTTLLVMQIIAVLVTIALVVVIAINAVDLFNMAMLGESEDELMAESMAFVFQFLGMGLVLVILALVVAILHFIALCDLYMSANPGNAVLFLVLSIFFRIVEPFFMFACRGQDMGMPPRCDVPQEPAAYSYIPEVEPAMMAEPELVEEPAEESEA